MEALFLQLLNMSITASFVILAVMLLRFLLKKSPKWISCALWALVAVRLICPISIESVLSLIPSSQTVNPDIAFSANPMIDSGINAIDSTLNPIISERFATETGAVAPEVVETVNPLSDIINVLSVVWFVGVAAMLIYALVSYLLLRKKVKVSLCLRENIYLCDEIASPFILGIIRPKIYLPSNINGEEAELIIAHEKSHLKRRDHLWKPLGFLLLSVYWFNPLCFFAYTLLCRDIELACDEKVIKTLDLNNKKIYSEALLDCSINRRSISACPLAFGEVGVKERVKSVLSYKKPAFWIIIVALILSAVTAVCFLTNPIKKKEENKELRITSVGTNYKGVDFEVVSVEDYLIFTVNWINNSGKEIVFGEDFYVSRGHDREKYVMNDTTAFNDIAHVVKDGGNCQLQYFVEWTYEIEKEGAHRLYTDFTVEGDSTEYEAWIEFDFGDIPSFAGKTLNTEKLVFDCGMFSFTPDPGEVYSVSENMSLYCQNEFIGKLTETELTRHNFDKLLKVSPIWSDGYSAKKLRRDNEKAWCVTENVGGDVSPKSTYSYYILLQKNGDIYFAFAANDGMELIRWIWKMSDDIKAIPQKTDIAGEYLFIDYDSIIYKIGAQTFSIDEPSPVRITEDMELIYGENCGVLRETELTEEFFEDTLLIPEWSEGYSTEFLRNNNYKTWYVSDENARRLVLLQNNGDIYIMNTDLRESKPYTFDIVKTKPIPDAYYYSDSPDAVNPTLTINRAEKSFAFTYSVFSSYRAFGKYELTYDGELICKTDDGKYTYVFKEEGDSFVFDASNSSEIPKYKYNGANTEPISPVPDKAVFSH